MELILEKKSKNKIIFVFLLKSFQKNSLFFMRNLKVLGLVPFISFGKTNGLFETKKINKIY
jgi:hypothetical protein